MKLAFSFLLSFTAALFTLVPLDVSVQAHLTLTVGLAMFALGLLWTEQTSFKAAVVYTAAILALQLQVYVDAVRHAVQLMS